MACCALGLLLVCQVFEAWRRLRVWLGMPARAVAHAGAKAERLRCVLLALLRRPWVRAIAVSLLTVELAVAGNLVYSHKDHLRQELAAFTGIVFGQKVQDAICTTAASARTSAQATPGI